MLENLGLKRFKRSESFKTGAHSHEYSFDYAGDTSDFHRVTATHKATGEKAGNLDWGGSTSEDFGSQSYSDGNISRIRNVEVHSDHQRKGLATAMLDYGHHLARSHSFIPTPEHSPHRSEEGEAWAKTTNYKVPKRAAPESTSWESGWRPPENMP